MKNSGHTIAEYAIIGFLVVLVAIPALGTLGGEIDALLNGSGQEVSQADGLFSLLSGGGGGPNGGPGADSPAAAVTGGGQDNPAVVGTSGVVPDSSALTPMASGSMATSINGQDDLVKAVSEVGASGVMASRLEAFNAEIDSRLDSGQITPEQAALLRGLSNQGHRIATIEKMVEDANSFHEPVTFEGRTYSNLHEFSRLIGFQGKTPVDILSGDLMKPGDGSAGVEVRKFQEAYQQVNQNMGNDAELQSMVSDLSTEIVVLTEMVEDAAWNKGQNPGIDLKQFAASRITKMDSDAFCAAGGGSGTGAICK